MGPWGISRSPSVVYMSCEKNPGCSSGIPRGCSRGLADVPGVFEEFSEFLEGTLGAFMGP